MVVCSFFRYMVYLIRRRFCLILSRAFVGRLKLGWLLVGHKPRATIIMRRRCAYTNWAYTNGDYASSGLRYAYSEPKPRAPRKLHEAGEQQGSCE